MKYNFKGISKLSATMMFTALAGSPLSFLTNGILGKVTFYALQKFSNWLANEGLILANVGVEFIDAHRDKLNFDSAIEEALKKVSEKSGRLSEEEKKEIDDKVIKAFNEFAVFVRNPQ